MDTHLDRALSPATLGRLELPNRIIKAATFEGKTPNGQITPEFAEFHQAVCEGGVGMTTLAYCATEPDGRMHQDMIVMNDSIRQPLSAMIEQLHATGAKVSGQMGHCGHFSKNKNLQRSKRPLGPSGGINNLGMLSGMPFTSAMQEKDIKALVDSYYNAARFMKEVGFDALEIHFGHGYALSQFISPLTNKRNDQYGGSLSNRMRVPLSVLEAVKKAVGDDLPVIGKISMFDAVRGGTRMEDALQVAEMLDHAGIDGIITSAGTSSGNPMPMVRGDSIAPGIIETAPNLFAKFALKLVAPKMFRDIPYKELFLLDRHKQIRERVKNAKMIYIGGCHKPESLAQAMAEGIDFVQVARALIKDPAFVNNLKLKGTDYRNGCTHCNYCLTSIERPGGVHCELNLPKHQTENSAQS